MKLLEESFTLLPDDFAQGYPLYITAKRYWYPYQDNMEKESAQLVDDANALTMIALHSTSFHKETWEPTLEAMFMESAKGMQAVNNIKVEIRIREVWAIDCPNHGHSGILNREALKRDEFASDFTCEHYAKAIYRFLSRAPDSFGVDFRKRRLVGLGHSLGANALSLLQEIQPTFPFTTLIIVEPMVSPGGDHHIYDLRVRLAKGAKQRVFSWPNKVKAFSALRSSRRTAKWDERVLKAFVEHAIGKCPDSDGVCLACTREQEHNMYLDVEGATRPAEELIRICRILPVHLILGSVKDFLPPIVHKHLTDPTLGWRYSSITELPGVGHLIPQEIPDRLGVLVYEILEPIAERHAKL